MRRAEVQWQSARSTATANRPANVWPDPARDKLSRIERAYVQVRNGSYTGSGAIIGDRLVVTAGHLFSGKLSGRVSVVVPGMYWYRARPILVDRQLDLAIVEVAAGQKHFPPPIPLADHDAVVGDTVTRVGHPWTYRGRYPEVVSGRVSGKSEFLFYGKVSEVLEVAMRTVSGHSGSGVFNSGGEYVGTVPWADPNRNSNALVQPVSVVRRLLDRCHRRRCPPLRPPVVEHPPVHPVPHVPAITGVVAHIGPVRAEIINRILHIWIPEPIRGIDGDNGSDGDDGVSPVFNLADLVDKVIEKLPPVMMEIHDGEEVFPMKKPLGVPIKIRIEGLLDARNN